MKANDPLWKYIFGPRSVAVIGASADLKRQNSGRDYLQGIIECGFKGKLYPVHPDGGELFNLKVYPDLKAIPVPVDYVISAIPARFTPQLVRDCGVKNVKLLHLFTSGFSEIEDKQGNTLQAEITDLARQYSVRLLGPNCMGIYCPGSGLTFSMNSPVQPAFPSIIGTVSLVSQSGGHSIYFIRAANAKGLYLNKVISYGNAADINESDLIEYLSHDPETKIIGAYIEGTKDGARLARTLREASKLKPVVVFKGGTTESGTRAAASHTSAIAGSSLIWKDMLRQSGAIQVDSMDEIVDFAMLYLREPAPLGRRTAILGFGGGASVRATDDCAHSDLTIPLLSPAIRQMLNKTLGSEAGHIFRNPIDLPPHDLPATIIASVANIIARSGEVDLLLFHIAFDYWTFMDIAKGLSSFVSALPIIKKQIHLPITVALQFHASKRGNLVAEKLNDKLCREGLAVYSSTLSAARSSDRLIRYQAWLNDNRN